MTYTTNKIYTYHYTIYTILQFSLCYNISYSTLLWCYIIVYIYIYIYVCMYIYIYV